MPFLLILFAVPTETSITQLFLAGPGFLVAVALVVMVQLWCRTMGYGKSDGEGRQPLLGFFPNTFWAPPKPVIIIEGIYCGTLTPTEAAAVFVFYALVLRMVIPPLGANL